MEVIIVNKKLVIINILVLAGLGIFAVMSLTVYYLIPAAGSAIDIVSKAIEQLIGIFI